MAIYSYLARTIAGKMTRGRLEARDDFLMKLTLMLKVLGKF